MLPPCRCLAYDFPICAPRRQAYGGRSLGYANNTHAFAALRACKEKYQGVARKGVEAIELKLQGYESVEIADLYGTTVNNVNAWISRARSKLRNEPALMEILC